MKRFVNNPIFMPLYTFYNFTVNELKKTFVFLGHETPSFSIYPTIYFTKLFNPPIAGT
jgi:hypothetical protein